MQDKVSTALQTVTTGGGATALIGGLTFNEVMAVAGLIVAIAGFIVNWYYQHKKFKLYEKEIKEK